MGLFSRRRSPPPSTELWRRGEVETMPLGETLSAVWRRGEPAHTLPTFAVDFALECRKFQPLRQHLAHYAELHGWDALQVRALEHELPRLTAAGLLVSTETLRAAAAEGLAATPPRLRAIALGTGGERGPLVQRALESFIQNLQQHGRDAEFWVADNSRNPDHTAAHLARLRTLRHPTLFAGPEGKRRWVDALLRTGACPPEVAEFALFDPLDAGFACGNNRNALLLHGAGSAFSCVDDDVIARLFPCPEPAAGVACISNADPNTRWLFANEAAALALTPEHPRDYLAVHEALLGHTSAGLPLDFTQAGSALIPRLARGPVQVRATFLGHVGDPGIPSSAYYLYYQGASRERLTASAAHYHSVFGSRAVFAAAAAPTLADASTSPGMSMAWDHRELLPPFCPVLHAEDFVWGATVWQCYPQGVLGHLPVAIHHAPGVGKGILTPAALRQERPFLLFEFAHLLRQWLLEISLPLEATPAERLRRLARELLAHAQVPTADFREELRLRTLRQVSERLTYLHEQLDTFAEGPACWREDVEALQHFWARGATQPDLEVPWDLRHRADALPFMQRLIGHFGALLQHWPDMVAAAPTLPPLLRPV